MDSNTSSSTKVDVYAIVTNRIIELLEQGTVPWQKPWTDAGVPANLLSKRPYRGINLWLLLSLNYERNLFLTWDQLKKIGGSVKQGEHGHVVIFWKTVKKTDAAEADRQKDVPLLRYYKVFALEQCKDIPEGLVPPLIQREHDPMAECEAIINGMPECPPIKFKESKAFYNVGDDYINMPKMKTFKSSQSYYSTLFHELVHSTGSEKRLKRPTITEMSEFGSELYSIEELVAELGAAYLCSFAGILADQIIDNTAYIKGWLSKLKDDKRFIVRASGYSQRAVDHILNIKEAGSTNEIEQSELLTEN
jgi:antirestriction protein ArdC